MSETVSTPEKPSDEKPAAAPVAEATAPVEKPFNIDILLSCTARLTRKTWDLLLTFRKENIDLFKTVPLRANLMARTPEGAQEIQKLLKEAGVTELTVKGKNIEMMATFEAIQHVIKHPQTYMLDAVKMTLAR